MSTTPGEWERRLGVARRTFVPWIDAAAPLAGRRVAVLGGGSGALAWGLAEAADSVVYLDDSGTAVDEAVRRCADAAIGNMTSLRADQTRLVARLGAERDLDAIVLFSALEHMTIGERLDALEHAASALAPDGVLVVAESPNRLLWHDYHTTDTPFLGMVPDELAVELTSSIRRTPVAQAIEGGGRTERTAVLGRWGRGISHHELDAVFGEAVHDHVIGTGWDPALRAVRPVHPEERHLARFIAAHAPHVAACFARYWVDLVLQPGSTVRRPSAAPVPLHSMGSTGVAITPWDTALVTADGVLRLDLPAAAERVAVDVVVGPQHAATGPSFELTGRSTRDAVMLAPHDPDGWVQQATVTVAGTDRIEVRAIGSELEIATVLAWTHVGGDRLPPLDVRRRGGAAALAAPAAAPRSLHGTYVGGGRMLVSLEGGGRLLIPSDDLSLMPELVIEGSYDAPFITFLRRVIRPDAVVVDVGANVGLFTVIAALHAPQGTVHAYEAAAEVAALLRDNVAANWLADRVRVREVAVGARAGTASFHFDPRSIALGGIVDDGAGDRTVPVVALADDLAGVDRIDLVKIDVEGGEADVLDGLAPLLTRVGRISCEVRTDATERMQRPDAWHRLVAHLGDLERAGWTCSTIAPDGTEVPVTVDEIVATQPHPNVVARNPDPARWRS